MNHATAPIAELERLLAVDVGFEAKVRCLFAGKFQPDGVACVCGAVKFLTWGFDSMADCVRCGRPDSRAEIKRLMERMETL